MKKRIQIEAACTSCSGGSGPEFLMYNCSAVGIVTSNTDLDSDTIYFGF